MTIRIGHGYDVHRFAEREADDPVDTITLAGVAIPCALKVLAHSDGDVVIHALCDAILGALGQGDIGRHFPDNDPQYRDIDSARLLGQVMTLVAQGGWGVVNADLTVVAQQPRLASHVQAMRERLAGLIAVDNSRVNIKATTTEGLGPIGRSEGIACHAVVLLQHLAAP